MSVKLFCTKLQAMPSRNIGYYAVFCTFKIHLKFPLNLWFFKDFVKYLWFFFVFSIDLSFFWGATTLVNLL